MRKSVKLTIAAGVVLVVALLVWWQNGPAPEPAEQPSGKATDQVAATPAPAAKPAAEPATEPAQEAEKAVSPVFDVVRVSPEGQAVIAGHAAPGQTVEILLDGAVIGAAVAEKDGSFATVLEISASGAARELALRVPAAGGSTTVVARAPVPEAETATAAQQGAAEVSAAPQDNTATGAAGVTETVKEKATEAVTAAVTAAATGGAKGTAEAEGVKGAGQDVAATGTGQSAAVEAEKGSEGIATKRAGSATETATEASTGTAEQAAAVGSGSSGSDGYSVSAPVIILPQADAEQAPVLVKPEAEDVTLLQPAAVEPGGGIVLDRITYSHEGDLIAAGRGQPGTAVRIYVNAEFIAEVLADEAGQWRVELAKDVAAVAQLLRFDEVDAAGKVVSRLETPFEYSPSAATQMVRQRKIEVQKGDYLWKFAEQYYGAGWRYSVIFSANSALIRDPNLIYPGQVFTIPELVNSQ